MNCRVVTAARGWIGTPYVHQASCKGAGSDCLGLIRGIWRELHGGEPEVPPAYTMDWAEPQGAEALWQAARRHLVEKPRQDAAPGDVILFRMRSGSVAKHLGVQSAVASETRRAAAAPAFIHAYAGHGVVESPLSPPWQRRIVARFSFP
ncbi:NlpC/P60 family protein [Leisingera sp. ANG-Vp]|uniref:NlpC/P60 family protein n=1 Tax=Leisingera sp. ANG-Vp TaxID=1577896 RepID=UPI00057DEAFF|nr:NlpC/P60 family protein [Leisingera sp. ANG-Vp]KIC22641.1 peptidase [Leisingera sp. ANG-Vp]